MPVIIGIVTSAVLYAVISIVLSRKFRGEMFPESESGFRRRAERLKDRPSYIYVLDENGKNVKAPASKEVDMCQRTYKELYDRLMAACDNAKGKHHWDGKLHGDNFTDLIGTMMEYRAMIADIEMRERGSRPEYIEDNEHFIIADDKDFIFMIFNVRYRCMKALKKDKRDFIYLVYDSPMYGTNAYGLPKRFTDVERYMLEHDWDPRIPFALNKVTGPIIKHMNEPFPIVDKNDSLYNYIGTDISESPCDTAG